MNKFQRKHNPFTQLQELGFSFHEAQQLRRIEMTLHRWAELECGTDAGHIERDEKTGKPLYQQTDPRGCALYLIRPGDIPAGESVEAYYTRGLAVCA